MDSVWCSSFVSIPIHNLMFFYFEWLNFPLCCTAVFWGMHINLTKEWGQCYFRIRLYCHLVGIQRINPFCPLPAVGMA